MSSVPNELGLAIAPSRPRRLGTMETRHLKLTVPVLATSVSQCSGTTVNSYHTAKSHQSPSETASSYYTAGSASPFVGTPSTAHSNSATTTFGISEDEMIIAVMGPTGAGKSTFVKLATGSDDVQISHSLRSYTQHIRVVRCHNPLRERNVVFVDTPGFDDTTRSDTEILAEVADWLEKTYKAGVKLSGILYLHRITDNRMTNTLIRNLDMFQNLCGNSALSNVRLVTTHWDQLKDVNQGVKNEGELRKKYWNTFLCGGSQMTRFEYSCSSAWKIIDSLPMEPKAMKIQKEMVDQHKTLWETSAARSLLSWVHRAVEALKNFIRQLEELIQKVTSADSSENKKRGRESEKKKREEELKSAQKLLKKLENDKSQFYNRTPTINSNHSSRSPSPDSTSTASTWRYIAHKISDRSEKSIRRRLPRHSPALSPCSESETAVADSPEGPYTFCDSPGPNSTSKSLPCTIQRLQALRVTASPGVMSGFEDAVEITLEISEALNETSHAHSPLSSLMDSTSWFLCALSDKSLPTREYPNSATESLKNIRRQLMHIQDIVTRHKDCKTEPQMSLTLSPDDRRAISECREAVTSALHELNVN